ncbi:MAG TPA: hypothetical protein VHF89_03420, partial [Solirubrobacteraceae bacterium]|nr:hypothetical protein [Solirubrobacteraceae bacterium]
VRAAEPAQAPFVAARPAPGPPALVRPAPRIEPARATVAALALAEPPAVDAPTAPVWASAAWPPRAAFWERRLGHLRARMRR